MPSNINIKQQHDITEYNKRKMFDIFGIDSAERIWFDPYCDIRNLFYERKMLIKKWYEVEIIKTIPFQNFTLLSKNVYNVNDFFVEREDNIIVTGIGFNMSDLNYFANNTNALEIGTDEQGNYYQIYSSSEQATLIDINFPELNIDIKMLTTYFKIRDFLLGDNPGLLNELDEIVKKTGSNSNETIQVLFKIWEYLEQNNKRSKLYLSLDYCERGFDCNCKAFKILQCLVNRETKIKETPITLYGQMFRPVKKIDNKNASTFSNKQEVNKQTQNEYQLEFGGCICIILSIIGIIVGALTSLDYGNIFLFFVILLMCYTFTIISGKRNGNMLLKLIGISILLGIISTVYMGVTIK